MLISPFGPSIYKSTIKPHFIEYLVEVSDDSMKAGQSVGYDLAGNIKHQYQAVVDPQKFIDYIYQDVYEYVKATQLRSKTVDVLQVKTFSLSFDLGSGPWINYQHKHEFNPVHSHDGDLSAVVMIDIPEKIAEEVDKPSYSTNMCCPGQLEFISYGGDGTYKVLPKSGDIYIFPSDLRHCVYPFTSDVERITMSFNVYNLVSMV